MKRVYSSLNRSKLSSLIQFPVWRKLGFLTTAVAVGLTGWLLAEDPNNQVPSPPTPATDRAVPNPVPEVLGTGPGEVLTRGPIHEAFAQPVVENTAEPPIVPKAPPALIEELPPDERPVGENVLWIPGYYAWDEDRLDFIWISGVYRDAPPGHTWVTGYWRSAPGGSQWVPGFWTTAEQPVANQQAQTEVEFLPEPPANIEQGPTTAQPGENHFWIPGNWRYRDNRYAWQAGYWSAGQAGWIWVPAHYNWTPQGYVYTQGFWDYSLAQRGLVFAPVYFDAAYYANPVVYRPEVLLRPNFLTVHLWSRPRYAHYYFGDYYGNNYATVGYRPWFSPLVANRNYYDPLFTYYAWQGRRVDPRWSNQVQQRYDYVVAHNDARPPRTYRDQYRLAQQAQYQQYVNNANIVNSNNTVFDFTNNNRVGPRNQNFGTEADVASLQIQNAAMTANLAQVVTQQKQLPQSSLRLEKVNPETLTRFTNQGKQFREIAAQRQLMAGPRMPGVTTETVAPSTSGNPTTKTVTGDPRTKVGGGKFRLPVVQPVVDVAAAGRATVPAVGGTAGGVDVIGPGTPGNVGGQANTKAGFPGVNIDVGTKGAATPAGKNGTGKNTDSTDLPTDRNPNKLGKNVPPGEPPTGLGNGIVGGGFDTGVAPLDIISTGGGNNNTTINNPGTVQNGTNTNGTNTTGTNTTGNSGTTGSSPSSTPNTTATTVPGQRTPANGAFGQDQGALVPPGQLAPGQQNPSVFNPSIADPNMPTGSTAGAGTSPDAANPGTTGSSAKTTANTVPGQRTPTNGAFGQDQGALVPPGQLAPGQQNPGVFNPSVADPSTPTGSTAGAGTSPDAANPGTTGSAANTTATTVPGQRTPTNGAFGQDQGALVPPGQLAPGQQNPTTFNPTGAAPNVADPTGTLNSVNATPGLVNGANQNTTNSGSTTATGTNNTTGTKTPNATTNRTGTTTPGTSTPGITTPGTTTPGTNTTGTNPSFGTTGSAAGTTATPVPGQKTPANGAFGQSQGALVPPGNLAPGQQNPATFNPSGAAPNVADPTGTLNSKNATANPSATGNSSTKAGSNPGTAATNNTKSGMNPGAAGTNSTNPATKSGTTGTNNTKAAPPAIETPKTPRGKNLPTGPNMINGRPVGGNPGNANPVLGTGPSAGPKINPNANPLGAGANGLGNAKGLQNPDKGMQNPNKGMQNPNKGKQNPNKGGAGSAPVGPGGGGGGLAPVGAGAAGAAPAGGGAGTGGAGPGAGAGAAAK
jgi:hypothetical protein